MTSPATRARPATRPDRADPELARIESALRELRVAAPSSLLPDTLVAAGLADEYATIDTAIGPVWVSWNGRGVSALTQAIDGASFEADFQHGHDRPIRAAAKGLPPRLAGAIRRRLAGDRRVRIEVDLRGHGHFQQAVWMKALEIPRGEVRPYGWVAAEIGRPAAVRAVGTALAHNPVPLVIPCHRVVRTDGHIGQYSLGGPENKRTLLAWEGADPDGLERLAKAGIRYIGSDTTQIVCHPTCHNARRVTDRHRVSFHSLGEAGQRGYRPCKVCRPVSLAA
jgi:O-6-methylguanine DNA methyltransferase